MFEMFVGLNSPLAIIHGPKLDNGSIMPVHQLLVPLVMEGLAIQDSALPLRSWSRSESRPGATMGLCQRWTHHTRWNLDLQVIHWASKRAHRSERLLPLSL